MRPSAYLPVWPRLEVQSYWHCHWLVKTGRTQSDDKNNFSDWYLISPWVKEWLLTLSQCIIMPVTYKEFASATIKISPVCNDHIGHRSSHFTVECKGNPSNLNFFFVLASVYSNLPGCEMKNTYFFSHFLTLGGDIFLNSAETIVHIHAGFLPSPNNYIEHLFPQTLIIMS